MIKNGAKMEAKSKENRQKKQKIFYTDPVSPKIEKMSAPKMGMRIQMRRQKMVT